MPSVEQINKKRDERIAEFQAHGIKASEFGCGIAGGITFTAQEAAKLLELLRKKLRLEEKFRENATNRTPANPVGP